MACVAVLLLSSCTYSNIGSCIRNSGLTHTGVDVRHPVDGKMYQTPALRKAKTAYVRAPELCYRLNHPLYIACNIKGDCTVPEPYDIRPTGRVRLALAKTDSDDAPWRFRESVEVIPADARAYTVREGYKDKPELEDDRSQPRPAWWRYVAAAPFDYLLDPAITVVWNVTVYPLSFAALPFLLTFEEISYQTQSQPVPPPPPASGSEQP